MPAKNSTDGRATRIPAEPEFEQARELLDGESTTQGQRTIINRHMRELSEETGVTLPAQGSDLRDFYLEAAHLIGAAGPRWRMREALRLIAAGERFEDYGEGDPLALWQRKRARRRHGSTRSAAALLERRLSDPTTTGDLRDALSGALRDYCTTAGSEYTAGDPVRSYIEATVAAEAFDGLSPQDEPGASHNRARLDLFELLRGRRRPADDELRAIRARRALTLPPPEAHADGAPAQVIDLAAWRDSRPRPILNLHFAGQRQ